MKTITVNVSEPVYRDFQAYAESNDRTASELIREAMEDYRNRRIRPKTSLATLGNSSVREVLQPLSLDGLLDEMVP